MKDAHLKSVQTGDYRNLLFIYAIKCICGKQLNFEISNT